MSDTSPVFIQEGFNFLLGFIGLLRLYFFGNFIERNTTYIIEKNVERGNGELTYRVVQLSG